MSEDVVEIWKSYPSIDWLQGSNLGNVRTLDYYVKTKNGQKRFVKGHMLKQWRVTGGYIGVTFRMNGKKVHIRAHRIIASCFLPNPDHLPQVNHKNCVRDDNRVENLEWCDTSYNRRYTEEHGEALGRPVISVNLKTLEVSRFRSQHEAARQLGTNTGSITHVIKGRHKSHHGYYFTNADSQATKNVRKRFGKEVAYKVENLMESDKNASKR